MTSNQCDGDELWAGSVKIARPALRSAPCSRHLALRCRSVVSALARHPPSPAQRVRAAYAAAAAAGDSNSSSTSKVGWLLRGATGRRRRFSSVRHYLRHSRWSRTAHHLYFGLSLAFFAGQSSSFRTRVSGTVSTSVRARSGRRATTWLGPLTLRPFAALGVNHSKVSYSANYVFNRYQEDRTTDGSLPLAGAMAHRS